MGDAAGAGADLVWDTPEAARLAAGWIGARLGEPGTVGGSVPLGFAAYGCIPYGRRGTGVYDGGEDDGGEGGDGDGDGDDDGGEDDGDGRDLLDRLLDVLGPLTGMQTCHFAVWEGYGGTFREADGHVRGMAVLRIVPDEPRRWWRRRRSWVDQTGLHLRGGRSARRLERTPAAEMPDLDLPERPADVHVHLDGYGCYLWSGRLSAARALAGWPATRAPDAAWPADHHWFVRSPVYSRVVLIGGTEELVVAVCREIPEARRVEPGDRVTSPV